MQRLSDFMRNDVVDVAEQFDHGFLTVEHVCFALLSDEYIIDLLAEMGINTEGLFRAFMAFLADIKTHEPFVRSEIKPDDLLQHVIAVTIGKAVGTITLSNASLFDLFLTILKLPPDSCAAAHIFNRANITVENTTRFMADRQLASFQKSDIVSNKSSKSDAQDKPTEESEQKNNTPFKNEAEAEEFVLRYSVNLNSEASAGRIDPLIGRDDEIAKTIQVLMRRRKNNPLLIGEAGVGKTAIAEGMALRIIRGEVPRAFSGKVIYSLDVGSLVAGTRYRGDFEERMRHLIQAFSMMPQAIIFIDEIHLIVDGGKVSSGSMDASNLLKPALARGTIRCIGATTFEDYRKSMERDRALLRRFKNITILQPTPEQAKSIILGLRTQYESYHGVTYTVAAVNAAVDLVTKYFRDATLPDRAIDLIDDAGARQSISAKRLSVIDRSEIEQEVAMITDIPLMTIRASAGQSILQLGSAVKQQVYGQDQAVQSVTEVIKIARAGLRPTNKPEAAFLFVGPTGVGKTELARALAKQLNIKLIKYDMSEYMERHSISRLIGSPPGYVGFDGGGAGSGLLINDVEQNPRCVLLLDEIEKAHPDVFNILLQVMDDARLTNGSGKAVDFRNVILIMTSNAGAAQMSKSSMGFRPSDQHAVRHDQEAIKKHFSPEFLGRLDGIIPFMGLSAEQLERVTIKMLDEISVTLLERGISFTVNREAVTWLAQKGYDPRWGARPIARTIDKYVRLPLADLILSESVREGWTVSIGRKVDELDITTISPPIKELQEL